MEPPPCGKRRKTGSLGTCLQYIPLTIAVKAHWRVSRAALSASPGSALFSSPKARLCLALPGWNSYLATHSNRENLEDRYGVGIEVEGEIFCVAERARDGSDGPRILE